MRWLVLCACLVVASLLPSAANGDEPSRTEGADAAARGLPPHYVLPSDADMRLLFRELPPGAVPATVPVRYGWAGGRIVVTRRHFAILSGDVDADAQGSPELVVGCYFPSTPSEGGTQDDRARIVVFKRVGRIWVKEWTSPGLGYEFDRPRYNIEEVEQGLESLASLAPPVQLVKILGDRQYSIAYFAWSKSAQVGGLPGIYRYSGGRWHNVAPQADRFSIRDLDGDGEIQVVAGTRYVGFGSGDDDVPRVYRWDGRRFEEASSRFPRFYRDLAEAYRHHVRELEERHQLFARDVWERAIRKADSFGAAAASQRESPSLR